MARCPTSPPQVSKQVADSGDVAMQKPGFSIVDTHEPTICHASISFSLDGYSAR